LSNHYAPIKLGKRISNSESCGGGGYNSQMEFGANRSNRMKMRRTSVQSSIGGAELPMAEINCHFPWRRFKIT